MKLSLQEIGPSLRWMPDEKMRENCEGKRLFEVVGLGQDQEAREEPRTGIPSRRKRTAILVHVLEED